MNICIADKQDITRAGLMYIISQYEGLSFKMTEDKAELIEQLKSQDDSIVIMDYTLFDINDLDDVEILSLRFPKVQWVFFSSELTVDFARRLIAMGNEFSILLKDSPLYEIKECLNCVSRRQRFICQHMTEQLLRPEPTALTEEVRLTPTETEILKDIAMGMTTREIAEKRISSFHTVNTHRKNIFHKLGVNNVHEATKYALRSGLIDAAEYYI
jgi:DNA-binding NarL/FixJ family response regulator